jgi:hypothetical protein
LCQDSGVQEARYRHVLVRERGRLVGFATLAAIDAQLELLAGPAVRRTATRVRSVWPGALRARVLLGGLPVSFGRSCLRVARDADPVRVLRGVAEAAESVAGELGASVVAFKEFSPAEDTHARELGSAGYFRAESLPACSLAVRWRSFDDYLASMRSGYRRQLRGTLAASAQAALAVRTVRDFDAECPRLFALYEQVMDRAEFQLERLNLAFFVGLNAAFGDDSQAILVERGGQLAATAIMLMAPREATFLIAGIDYAQRDSGAYLRLVTEVVAHAIAAGASALEMGQTSYDLKRRLGARPVSRSMYVRHRSASMHWLLRAGAPSLFPSHSIPERRVFRGT